MKIYCSRTNDLNNMTDDEIYRYIAGKPLWILVDDIHDDSDLDLYVKINKVVGDMYYYDLFYTYNNVMHNWNNRNHYMFPIIRPVELITDAEVPDLTEYNGDDWL